MATWSYRRRRRLASLRLVPLKRQETNHSRKVACGGSVRKSGFNNHTVKMLRKTEENLTKATTTVCGTQKMRVRERRAAAWRWRKGRERGEEEEQTRPTVSSSGNSSGSSCVAIAGI